LVDDAKLRWRIERDYQELKQEVGLGHYESRGWRGFHHHATLCIAAYGFLISERETIPPSGSGSAARRQMSTLPEGHRSRGAADPTRASYPKLDRRTAPAIDHQSSGVSRDVPAAGAQMTRSTLRTYDTVVLRGVPELICFFRHGRAVMAGLVRLVPAIHVFHVSLRQRRGCPGQDPGMTVSQARRV
jgi:hypothetical protein